MENPNEKKDFIPNEGEVIDGNLDQVSGGSSFNPEDPDEGHSEVPFGDLEPGMFVCAVSVNPAYKLCFGVIIHIDRVQRIAVINGDDGRHDLPEYAYRFFIHTNKCYPYNDKCYPYNG